MATESYNQSWQHALCFIDWLIYLKYICLFLSIMVSWPLVVPLMGLSGRQASERAGVVEAQLIEVARAARIERAPSD